MTSKTVLQIEGLSVGYGSKELMKEVNFSVQAGELVGIIGPNGAGKSSLLRTICGLTKPLQGTIYFQNHSLAKLTVAQRAKVFSAYFPVLAPPFSVTLSDILENHLRANDRNKNLSPYDYDLLKAFGIYELLNTSIAEMSDGQRQKSFVVASLFQGTPISFFDEPLAFLDYPKKLEMIMLMKQFVLDQNKAMVLTIHDLDIAINYFNRLFLINEEGNYFIGSPHYLIEEGKIEQTFNTTNVKFDRMSKKFVVHRAV